MEGKGPLNARQAGVSAKDKRIVMLGAGAVGGYVGGHMTLAGYEVTLVDLWHDHIEAMRRDGLHLSGLTPEETCTVHPKTLHLHELSSVATQRPIDVAFLTMKSYDTDWIATLVRPYLAPTGYVVSLQNCMNEETIAGIVGWGKTLGCIASSISVELYEPGRVRRQAAKGSADHVVFRVGEVHGRITHRVQDLVTMLSTVDGTKPTTNLWGERWSKLVHNAMRNGISAATGLSSPEIDGNKVTRHFSIKLGGEAVRIGYALGFALEEIGKLDPQDLLRAADGDRQAFDKLDAIIIKQATSAARGALQRPSMGQDMAKGRRTEIEYINGFIARKGREIGIDAPANAELVRIVQQVERREIPARPENIPQV